MSKVFIAIVVIAIAAMSGCTSTSDSATDAIGQSVVTDVGDAAASSETAETSNGDADATADAGDEAAPSPTVAADDEPDSAELESQSADLDERTQEFLATFEHFRWKRVSELRHIPIGDIEATFGSDVFPQELPAGDYATGVLGTEIAFHLDNPAILAREFPGMLSFVDIDLAGTLHIARPNAIYSVDGVVSDANFFNYRTGSAPMPADFDQWLRSITQIEVDNSEEVTVAGQPAVRYELTPRRDDFFFCRRGTCLNLFLVGPDKIQLFGHQRAVLWHVPHPEGDLVIVAKADPERYDTWLGFAESVLDSLTLGEPEKSPVSSNQYWSGWGTVGPGEWIAPGLPWVFDFQFPESGINHKDGYLSAAPVNERRGMTVTRFVETRDGLTATVDSIDTVLREKYDGLAVTELDSEVVLGYEARAFDIGSKPGDLEFKHVEDAPGVDVLGTDNYALIPTPVRMWAFEHEGELWIAATGAMNEEEFAMTLAWARDVLANARLREQSAVALGGESSVVEPGTYITDSLGFPLTIQTDDRWLVITNDDQVVNLAAADPDGAGPYQVVFAQPTSLVGPGVGLDGWLDSAPDSVVIGDVTEVSIGGRAARRVDLRLSPEADCAIDNESCVRAFAAEEYEQWLSRDTSYRFVWFQDDLRSVAVIATPTVDEWWLDTGLDLVQNATFAAS